MVRCGRHRRVSSRLSVKCRCLSVCRRLTWVINLTPCFGPSCVCPSRGSVCFLSRSAPVCRCVKSSLALSSCRRAATSCEVRPLLRPSRVRLESSEDTRWWPSLCRRVTLSSVGSSGSLLARVGDDAARLCRRSRPGAERRNSAAARQQRRLTVRMRRWRSHRVCGLRASSAAAN